MADEETTVTAGSAFDAIVQVANGANMGAAVRARNKLDAAVAYYQRELAGLADREARAEKRDAELVANITAKAGKRAELRARLEAGLAEAEAAVAALEG